MGPLANQGEWTQAVDSSAETIKTDPLGRQTTYTYAANGLDLLEVRQVNRGSTDLLATYAGYNALHLPATLTDGAGQTTTTTYNAAGQPLTVTNAKSEVTTYTYAPTTGYLQTVAGPVGVIRFAGRISLVA